VGGETGACSGKRLHCINGEKADLQKQPGGILGQNTLFGNTMRGKNRGDASGFNNQSSIGAVLLARPNFGGGRKHLNC